MWPTTFKDRLEEWSQLRSCCLDMPVVDALTAINAWWFRTPWRAYHLHWDDQPSWPDPWQLLSDDIYCPLARGLGMLYTISLLERNDIQNAILADIATDNLVLVDKEKYILNWDPQQIVNINLEPFEVRRSVFQKQIK
jgi:hypothetical protein